MDNNGIEKLFDEINDLVDDLYAERGITRKNEIETFRDDHELLIGLANEYADKKAALLTEAEKNIARIEYGIGGECVHRGPYCPSLIEDIVIGNLSRGMIAKKATKKPSYTFCFDKNGLLIASFGDGGKEVVIRDGKKEIGITYHVELDIIEAVSYCVYSDVKLLRYVFAPVIASPSGDAEINLIKAENYTYSENEMVVDWHDGHERKGFWSDDRHLYRFPLENGYMTGKYTIKTFADESLKEYWKDAYGFKASDASEFEIPEKLRRKVF